MLFSQKMADSEDLGLGTEEQLDESNGLGELDGALLDGEGDGLGDGDGGLGDGDPAAADDPELEAIKARVREMEEEAEKLKQLQTEVDKQMNMGSPPGLSKFIMNSKCYRSWATCSLQTSTVLMKSNLNINT